MSNERRLDEYHNLKPTRERWKENYGRNAVQTQCQSLRLRHDAVEDSIEVVAHDVDVTVKMRREGETRKGNEDFEGKSRKGNDDGEVKKRIGNDDFEGKSRKVNDDGRCKTRNGKDRMNNRNRDGN